MRGWLLAVLLGCHASLAAAEQWKNWFDDPFFQPRHGQPTCPAPAGPFLPESQRNGEAHYRIERGTSCWLAGTCKEPNAYRYDAGIGKSVEAAFAQSKDFSDASLWVTVQRRFVLVQGCISDAGQEQQLRQLIEPLPDVERVILELSKPGKAGPAYQLAPRGKENELGK